MFLFMVSGSGGTQDPYVWNFMFELDAMEVAESNFPLKDDTIACWLNPNPEHHNIVSNGDRDLAHNSLYAVDPPVIAAPDSTPSTKMNETSSSTKQVTAGILALILITLLI